VLSAAAAVGYRDDDAIRRPSASQGSCFLPSVFTVLVWFGSPRDGYSYFYFLMYYYIEMMIIRQFAESLVLASSLCWGGSALHPMYY
jgi:hypothetical protein